MAARRTTNRSLFASFSSEKEDSPYAFRQNGARAFTGSSSDQSPCSSTCPCGSGARGSRATTGAWLWLEQESLLDAVTALSGSGPAYVFYFLEAMTEAGEDMGLTREQAHQLAVGTFAGASELARRSDESPAVLRQRVTSKGGTTHAAIESMEADDMAQRFMRALDAAEHRARELGDEFGATN